ncbi:MAG: hypothetical protein VX641_04040 [Planctomycetota bacterium]|nr:hypothetical protein [Planctomycetota bacterium]
MLKSLKAIAIGIVIIVLGVLWIIQPGHQGVGGGIALTLFGVLVLLGGLKMLTGGPRTRMSPSRTTGSSRTGGTLFSGRRVIVPQDSRPEPPFDL